MVWLSSATNKNMDNSGILLPTFDYFLWPIVEFMKSEGKEQSRPQILEAIVHNSDCNFNYEELDDNDKKEIYYRVSRAFDLLLVADILEEKLGNLYALTAGALTVTEKEVRNLPRHVRTLDNYFNHNGSDTDLPEIEKREIAEKIVELLEEEEELNYVELQEKLIDCFLDKDSIGRNVEIAEEFLKKVAYVKQVLESKNIIEENADAAIELVESGREAELKLEKHYQNSFTSIGSFIDKLLESLKKKRTDFSHYRKMNRVIVDSIMVIGAIGVSLLLINRKK